MANQVKSEIGGNLQSVAAHRASDKGFQGVSFQSKLSVFSISRNECEFDTNATVTGQFEH